MNTVFLKSQVSASFYLGLVALGGLMVSAFCLFANVSFTAGMIIPVISLAASAAGLFLACWSTIKGVQAKSLLFGFIINGAALSFNIPAALPLFCTIIGPVCSEARYEQYRREDFSRTFDTAISKVSNFRGKHYSTDLSGGWISAQSYRFESAIPLKINDFKTYRKTEPGKMIAFLENKTLVDANDLKLLKINKDKLTTWEWNKYGPVYDSGANRIIQYSKMTTWIVYFPGAVHRYFVVNVQEDTDVH